MVRTWLNPVLRVLTFFAAGLAVAVAAQSQSSDRWWSATVEARLAEAGTNRAEIVRALAQAPVPQREGIAFLIENMPSSDLTSLSGQFLLGEVGLAYRAWESAPWKDKVTKEMFFNDVLPYACLSETREPWRTNLAEVCSPIVANCKTPGEAGHLLNQKIFPLLKVRYNTGRKRPDQSPSETIKSGMATCTGLSILLVDACRSVGIPARVVGIPMWSNMRGNHTWVEIWDGDWHFAGAAEPDAAGLDRGWFVHDASQAQRDVPRHAIYASSFRRTGLAFPLVWETGDKSVSAVNVTDRYTAKAPPKSDETVRLCVKVVQPDGKRVVADVILRDTADAATEQKDKSRGETADLNDFASFKVIPGRKYRVSARLDGRNAELTVDVTKEAEQLAVLTLGEKPVSVPGPQYALPQDTKPLSTKDVERLKKALSAFFTADATKQAVWKFPSRTEKLLRENEPAVRQLAWEAYRTAPIHADLKADYEAHIVKSGNYQSPYTVKTVGQRPPGGWPLFIAMHGGGGAPKAVNDRQWEHMKIYYKEHPEVGGYLYLALRAPNDEWNGFYADYVYPLIDKLIRQFRLFGDIDPDKVFIMGYSHGGYGAYAIGPKMPDRFAAIHASAAAGTDGETTGRTLRTTPFTAMVGEKDTMYGRYSRNLKFKEEIEQLRGTRTDIYPVQVTVIPGNGHTGLPDRDKIVDMYPAVRNPIPREIDWFMTDGVVQDFFWLQVPKPAKQQEIVASCQNNKFAITANAGIERVTVLMDTRLVDYSKPVSIELNGATTTRRFKPSLKVLCENLVRRADPGFAFSGRFTVVREQGTDRMILAPEK
jgi:pimeloyl-ACP methyl ester carboxylesterase